MDTRPIIPSPLVKQFAAKAPRGEALDMGSGAGNNSLFLARQGFSVTAVEIKEGLASALRRRAEENQIELAVDISDLKNVSIKENYYSLIVATNSLNFFSKEDFLAIVEKIKRGLQKDGLCIITLFTDKDQLFEDIKAKTMTDDGQSFFNDKGGKWYFPHENQLREIFEKDFTILFYTEAMVEDKGHPNKPEPHTHVIARMVAKK